MREWMEKMVNQGCGERRAPQAQQDHEESQDSKAKLAMLASPDRRAKLVLQARRGHLEDRDMMVILVLQDLREDPDLLVTLVPQALLDPLDLQARQEWA